MNFPRVLTAFMSLDYYTTLYLNYLEKSRGSDETVRELSRIDEN